MKDAKYTDTGFVRLNDGVTREVRSYEINCGALIIDSWKRKELFEHCNRVVNKSRLGKIIGTAHEFHEFKNGGGFKEAAQREFVLSGLDVYLVLEESLCNGASFPLRIDVKRSLRKLRKLPKRDEDRIDQFAIDKDGVLVDTLKDCSRRYVGECISPKVDEYNLNNLVTSLFSCSNVAQVLTYHLLLKQSNRYALDN